MQQGQHHDANKDKPQQQHDRTRDDEEEATWPNDDMTPRQNNDTTMPHTMMMR